MRIGGVFPGGGARRGVRMGSGHLLCASRRSPSSYGVPGLSDMGRLEPRPSCRLVAMATRDSCGLLPRVARTGRCESRLCESTRGEESELWNHVSRLVREQPFRPGALPLSLLLLDGRTQARGLLRFRALPLREGPQRFHCVFTAAHLSAHG